MAVRVETIDPGDAAGLDAAAALMTAWWREIIGPDEPATSPLEILHSLHVERDDIDARLLVARDGGDAVGYAIVDIRTGTGNDHMAWLPDLFVLPDARRRGAGRRLLDEVVAIARAAGRTLVMSGHEERSAGGAAFASAVGGRVEGQRERQNRVATAALDRPMLERWAASSPDGYRLVRIDDVVPDELLDVYVAMEAAMDDAPRSDSLAAFRHTPERRRASEAGHRAAGLHQWIVCAEHVASGELAGYTEVLLRPYKPWFVEQGDTGVLAAHRGHGLGRWLKATNALRILDERPDAQVVETWNDGSNRWMLAINDEMGFRPVATWVEVELDL